MFWKILGQDPRKIQRISARLIDYLLFFVLVGIFISFLPYFIDAYIYYLLALAIPFLWLPLEALLTSFIGTTPGKALFGITLRDSMGCKLSFLSALKRSTFIGKRPGLLRVIPLSFKRRLSGLFVGVGCILVSFFGNALANWSIGVDDKIGATGWVQYDSEDLGFSVQFPNDPEQTAKKFEIPNAKKPLNYHELTSREGRHLSYSVSHIELPHKWKLAGSTTLLKGALDAIVKYSPDTELVDKKFTTHQNYRALDFTLKQEGGTVKGRIIIVGTTLYKLTISHPSTANVDLLNNPFIDSFDLTS